MTALAGSGVVGEVGLATGSPGSGTQSIEQPIAVEVHAALAAVEAEWRALEAHPAAILTPYQRFDWIAAYLDTVGRARGLEPRIVLLRDAAGRVRLLLPLVVSRGRRRHGGPLSGSPRLAGVVGGKHANFHMPLVAGDLAPAAAADLLAGLPARLRAPVVRAALGVDAVRFALLPRVWDGLANPLARGAPPAASDAYAARLDADPARAVRGAFGGPGRRKLRSKERRLVEAFGPLEHRRARDATEIDALLAALRAHKAARSAALGIADPLADPAVRAFLRRACLAGLAEGRPAVELHALVATEGAAGDAGERVLSLYLGAVAGRRFSGMMTAFDTDPEAARGSPGDQLLARLVADQSARGRTVLDLGVGEARYKTSVCDEVVALADRTVALNARGALLAAGLDAATRARSLVKRTAWTWALWRRLRRRARDLAGMRLALRRGRR